MLGNKCCTKADPMHTDKLENTENVKTVQMKKNVQQSVGASFLEPTSYVQAQRIIN